MIAIDTNILVYAHRRDSEFHSNAARCVRSLAESMAQWAIAWPSLHEFFAIATHPRIYDPPSTTDQALAQIDAWLESPTVTLLAEPSEYWTELRALVSNAKLKGPMVHDARIAALCLTHGVRELWSADRDFSRFPSLRIRNPLLSPGPAQDPTLG